VSALTGKSADDMKKDRDAALQNLAFQAKLAKMDPAVRVEMEAALGSMPAGLQQAFKESVIFGRVMTDTGTIMSGAAPIIEHFANSVGNGTADFETAFQTFRDEMKNSAPEIRERLISLGAAGELNLLNRGTAITESFEKSGVALFSVLANVEAGTKLDVQNTKAAGKTQSESVEKIVELLDTQRELMHVILEETQKKLPQITTVMLGITDGLKTMFDEAGQIIDGKLPDSLKELLKLIDPTKVLNDVMHEAAEGTRNFSRAVTNFADKYLGLDEGASSDRVGKGVAHVLAFFGNEEAQAALDADAYSRGEINEPEERRDVAADLKEEKAAVAAATTTRAQIEIDKLREEIAEIKKEDKRSALSTIFGDTKQEEIDKKDSAIERLMEMQTKSLEKLIKLQKQTLNSSDKGNAINEYQGG
jgi:hypothetical protein